jgi:deoxyinosine 3'endonuclease (endonuclease V)
MEASTETLAQWAAEQDRMRAELAARGAPPPLAPPRRVGGVDISFSRADPGVACAYLAVVDADTLAPLYEDYEIVAMTIPYVSGFLGFREVPHYLALVERVRARRPDCVPEVILVDGFGSLHPRGLGSASHLGLACGIPTVGCAKTLLGVDGLSEASVKKEMASAGAVEADLVGESGAVHGRAILAGNSTKNPVYVSAGYGVGLDDAAALVRKMCRFKIPEPIRLADINSKLHFS